MAEVHLKNVNKIYPSPHGDVHAVKDFFLDSMRSKTSFSMSPTVNLSPCSAPRAAARPRPFA